VKHAAAVLAPRVRCLGAPEGAGFSQRVNQAALLATGEYLVVMDPDVEVVDGEWIGALLELCQLRGIGAVAPPSVTRDDTFSDAGVGFQDCLPYPAYQGTPAHYPGPPGASITVARNYLAVDGGGMMTPRRVFFEAGGFCTQFLRLPGRHRLLLEARHPGPAFGRDPQDQAPPAPPSDYHPRWCRSGAVQGRTGRASSSAIRSTAWRGIGPHLLSR